MRKSEIVVWSTEGKIRFEMGASPSSGIKNLDHQFGLLFYNAVSFFKKIYLFIPNEMKLE